MIKKQQTEIVIRRLLKGGVIKRIPRRKKDAEVFLALAASSFDPQSAYTESETNEHLIEWLAGFTCPFALDHVTVRRCLVDFCFLSRDQSGSSYTTNQTLIGNVIEPAARSVQPRYVLEEVQREKDQRKRATPQNV